MQLRISSLSQNYHYQTTFVLFSESIYRYLPYKLNYCKMISKVSCHKYKIIFTNQTLCSAIREQFILSKPHISCTVNNKFTYGRIIIIIKLIFYFNLSFQKSSIDTCHKNLNHSKMIRDVSSPKKVTHLKSDNLFSN